MIIHDALLITMDEKEPIIPDGALYIKENKIVEVGTSQEILGKYKDFATIRANGRVVMPGLINGHMHLYSTFARGLDLKNTPPESFIQILEKLWWRLDKALTEQAIYYSALTPLLQAVRCGTTTLIDHHASPRALRGSLFLLANLFEEIGLRGCLCYEVSDRDGEEIARLGIEENRRFIASKAANTELMRGLFGLHAQFTLSDETLRQCREAAESAQALGFHIHCAEALSDQEAAQAKHGKRVVERLKEFGILGLCSVAAHCVHVNDHEMGLLAESGTFVAHNPRSNMNNAVGCAPVARMLGKGVLVGLGTDGMSASMWDELKVGNLLHKHASGDSNAGTVEIFRALFYNNAAFASRLFGETIGILTPGALADIIILDYLPPTPLNSRNVIGHVLFGLVDASVETTIVNGRVIMRNHQILTIDEVSLAEASRKTAQNIWEKF
ncbi:MAG: putative aminohydrolase SsnA [bacterium]